MREREAQIIEKTKNEPKFVTEADWIPSFWNFLLALDRKDLIAELIQNDLDQEATQTIISFEQDQLVCEGNGTPVGPDGWRRLRSIQGAGDTVPAKRRKFGVKNHGLKTAFKIGDDIQVSSAGQTITQTLYADGRNNPPRPGASPQPTLDPQAPLKGCRIVIKYRDTDLEPPVGEANVMGAIGSEDIDALFKSACGSIPGQFAGIVSPEVAPQYAIVLRHWRRGEVRYFFSCTRPRKSGKGIEVFRRRCQVSGTASPLPSSLQEEAARRLLPLDGRLKERAADFYCRGRRFFVEVSWSVDKRGRPNTGAGQFRYPIGYPEASHESYTGHGTFFNAPIISDAQRHGPARDDATNNTLREACKSLLLDVLAKYVIPRWGADGLNPLVPNKAAGGADESIRSLLNELIQRDAMPVLSWSSALVLSLRGKRLDSGARTRRGPIPRPKDDQRKYRFLVPVATWAPTNIHTSLSTTSPRYERQLDPRIHPELLRLLTDGQTAGFCEHFITFDENDLLNRAAGTGNRYFAACENPEREFADPFIARAYLNVIEDAIEHEKCNATMEMAVQKALLLPDSDGTAAPFQILHASAPLPSDIPALRLPPVLHEKIATHPLFRRSRWRRPRYTMARFLESGTLWDTDDYTRRLFWTWLRQNEHRIGSRDRAILADIAIWPDVDNRVCKLAELCDPQSQRVAAILGASVRRPHEQVRRSRIAGAGRRRRTSIRRLPSQAEINHWFEMRMSAFIPGDMPDADIVTDLRRFESDVTVLLKDQGIARVLKAAAIVLPAVARDGSIRHRSDLVMLVRGGERLGLLGRFVIKETRLASSLDKLAPTLSAPTSAMLLSTFEEDRCNFDALQARLHQFLTATGRSDSDLRALAAMPILPFQDQPRAPRELAFIGSKGDYWGSWKYRLSGKRLSQDDQRRYVDVGVTSASPTAETSRSFFKWLAEQDSSALGQHVGCILRHILHRDGPESWARVFTDTNFIPTRTQNGLRLVSLRIAHNFPVYLPDAGNIADAVIANDPGVLIVITRVKEVTDTISEPMRRLGVRSLREAVGEPEHVAGIGNTESATKRFRDSLRALRDTNFRETFPKRLDELGVERELLRWDWYDRLSKIKAVSLADNVEARYHLRRKAYRIATDAGFDPASGTFWIKMEHANELSALYEAVAAQLVFKSSARPVHLLALEKALALEIRDPTFGKPRSIAAVQEETDEAAVGNANEGNDEEPVEAAVGHSPFRPDASRNIPRPEPLPSSASVKSQRPDSARERAFDKSNSDVGPAPELEKDHVDALKGLHYASHCQMCLCERAPQELAPAGSYIEWEEVRRRVVEAHHVDLKSAGGARHAGNLILLCKLHHDNYGRRLTRASVAVALNGKKKQKTIRFGDNSEVTPPLTGQTIELVIPDTGEIISLFFTDEHASYWLSNTTTGG